MKNVRIKVAIAGVGNCASALVQGVEYYKNAKENSEVPGLMHVNFGGYHIRDIEFVAAFDVNKLKTDNNGEQDTHLSLGKGNINFSTVLASLRKIEYKGPLIVEVHSSAGLKESVTLLRRTFRERIHSFGNKRIG